MHDTRFTRRLAKSWRRICGAAVGCGIGVSCAVGPAQGAVSVGTFVNMDFETWEMAGPPFQFSGDVRVPGWTTNSPSGVMLDKLNLGDNAETFLSTGEGMGALGGRASINILGSYWLPNEAPPPRIPQPVLSGVRLVYSAIEQTGQIPAGYASMRFSYAGSLPIVFVGDQLVRAVALGNGMGAVDVSAFAGQTVAVQFRADYQDEATVLEWGSVHYARYSRLDDILFSTEPIPEPSALLLLAASSMVMMACRQRTLIAKCERRNQPSWKGLDAAP